MSATVRCRVCLSDFRMDALKDGLCVVCQREYPNAKGPKDILSKDKILNQGMIGLTDVEVRAIVRDELATAGGVKAVVVKGAADGK